MDLCVLGLWWCMSLVIVVLTIPDYLSWHNEIKSNRASGWFSEMQKWRRLGSSWMWQGLRLLTCSWWSSLSWWARSSARPGCRCCHHLPQCSLSSAPFAPWHVSRQKIVGKTMSSLNPGEKNTAWKTRTWENQSGTRTWKIIIAQLPHGQNWTSWIRCIYRQSKWIKMHHISKCWRPKLCCC